MPQKIRVYHSFRSPYARLGLHILKRENIDADLIPFTGPPEGVPFNDPAANKLKLSYLMADVGRMTERMGLSLSRPDSLDIDLESSYKASVAAELDGKGLPFALAVSDARWGEGANIADLQTLKACARAVGWDDDNVDKAQSAISVGKAMKEHRSFIEEDGVFGVPFAVLGAHKYWGHDRFDLLAQDAKS